MKRTILILTLAGGLVTAGLAAQEHEHRHAGPDSARAMMGAREGRSMSGMMAMMANMQTMPGGALMMRAMRFTPQRVRAHAEALGLSADQTAALDRLIERQSGNPKTMMQAMKAATARLSEQFDALTIDTAAVRAAALDVFRTEANMHANMLVNAAAVRAILMPAQRERAAMMPMNPMNGMGGPGHNRSER